MFLVKDASFVFWICRILYEVGKFCDQAYAQLMQTVIFLCLKSLDEAMGNIL